jgi:hypothetical protein
LGTSVVGPVAISFGVRFEDDILLFGLLKLFPISSFIAPIALIGCFVTSSISINTHSVGMGIVEDFSSSSSNFAVVSTASPLSDDGMILTGETEVI